MKSFASILLLLLLMDTWTQIECRRSFSWGGSKKSVGSRRGSSRGSSPSSSSSSSSGVIAWNTKTSHTPSAPKPASPGWVVPPKPAYQPSPSANKGHVGWVNPSQTKPAAAPSGFVTQPKVSQPSSNIGPGGYPVQPGMHGSPGGFVSKPATAPAHGPGYPVQPGMTNVKPPPYSSNVPQGHTPLSHSPSTGGFVNPSQPKVGQPSSNIGPGGYPVQPGMSNVKPPPYSSNIPQGHSSYNPNTRINPPSYSPSYNNAPSYTGPKKVTVNNHYHYSSPPSYGGGHSNSFGYPGGYYGGGSPSYQGMNMFSSGHRSYGYPGSGSWGMPSYGGGSSSGGMVKGLLIGAAGGYLANSLIRSVTNPWGYSGSGYGAGYMSGYRDYMRHEAMMKKTETAATPAPAAAAAAVTPVPGANEWVNCIAYDPNTHQTLINPNCSCSVTVITDPATGLNSSHHDCTPYGAFAAQAPPMAPQPPMPQHGVNNPPPSFNGGGIYNNGAGYGTYGAGGAAVPSYSVSPPSEVPVVSSINTGVSEASQQTPDLSTLSTMPTPAEVPVTERQVGHAESIDQKRNEFYSKLEGLVNMGHFKD